MDYVAEVLPEQGVQGRDQDDQGMVTYFCSRDRYYDRTENEAQPNLALLRTFLKEVKWCPQEVRHAVRGITPAVVVEPILADWSTEWTGTWYNMDLLYEA